MQNPIQNLRNHLKQHHLGEINKLLLIMVNGHYNIDKLNIMTFTLGISPCWSSYSNGQENMISYLNSNDFFTLTLGCAECDRSFKPKYGDDIELEKIFSAFFCKIDKEFAEEGFLPYCFRLRTRADDMQNKMMQEQWRLFFEDDYFNFYDQSGREVMVNFSEELRLFQKRRSIVHSVLVDNKVRLI